MDELEPTMRERGSQIWFTWNPMSRTDWVWQNMIVNPPDAEDLFSVLVNYDDNHATLDNGTVLSFLSPEMLRHIERLKQTDDIKYDNIYGGNPLDEGGELHILSYAQVEACIAAYNEGLYRKADDFPEVVGVDLSADGKSINDYTAAIRRKGPVIEKAARWKARSFGATALKVEDEFTTPTTDELFYDATGVGSGFGEHVYNMWEKRPNHNRYQVEGVKFGELPYAVDTPFIPGHTQGSFFERKNIQMAWAIKIRAMNTERLLAGENIDPNECLFIDPKCIDNLDDLKLELVTPVYESSTQTYKMRLDKKGDPQGITRPV